MPKLRASERLLEPVRFKVNFWKVGLRMFVLRTFTASKRLISICFAVVGLSGCAFTSPYPDSWPAVESGASPTSRPCPSIAGFYVDKAISALFKPAFVDKWESPRLEGRHRDKDYLTYNLFSNARHVMRFANHVSDDVQQLIGHLVEIKQATPDNLQLIVWSSDGRDRFMLRQEVLSMKTGDFSCGPEGLKLKTRSEAVVLGVSNGVGSVARTLNRAADRSLVMKVEETMISHHFIFIPIVLSSGYWLRWEVFAQDSAQPAE